MDRRTFLRSTAGAATLGGITVTVTPSAAASPGLLALIADYKRAFMDWQRSIDDEDAFDEERRAKVRALRDAGASYAEYDALDEAMRVSPRAVKIERFRAEAGNREIALMEEIFAYPVATLADLRAKLEHLLSQPDDDESFGLIDHPTTRLMQSIMGGGLV